MVTSARARLRFQVRKSHADKPADMAVLMDRLHFLGLVLWVIALPMLLMTAVAWLFGNL